VNRFCTLRELNVVPEDVYRQQLASAMEFNADGRVGGITAETLVLTGDDDMVVPPANSRNLAEAIPGAQPRTIKGGGHMAFVERAGEFNAIVSEFLAK